MRILVVLFCLASLFSCSSNKATNSLLLAQDSTVIDESKGVLLRKPKYCKIINDSIAAMVVNESSVNLYSLKTGKLKYSLSISDSLEGYLYNLALPIAQRSKPNYFIFPYDELKKLMESDIGEKRIASLFPYFDTNDTTLFLTCLLNLHYTKQKESNVITAGQNLISINLSLKNKEYKLNITTLDCKIRDGKEYEQPFTWIFSGYLTNGKDYIVTGYNAQIKDSIYDLGSRIAKYKIINSGIIREKELPVELPINTGSKDVPFFKSIYTFRRFGNKSFISNGDKIFMLDSLFNTTIVNIPIVLKQEKIYDFAFNEELSYLLTTNEFNKAKGENSLMYVYIKDKEGVFKNTLELDLKYNTVCYHKNNIYVLHNNGNNYLLKRYAINN